MERRIYKVIAMISDKGGVGKSTWAASLTHAFNKAMGRNAAVLVDMDPSGTSTMLGSPNCRGAGSLAYITTRLELVLCTKETDGGEIDVVPPGRAESLLENRDAIAAYDEMISVLGEHYLIIVVDLPGVPVEYSPLITYAAKGADMLVVVTTQDAIHMARRLVTTFNSKPIYVILNQYIEGHGGLTDVEAMGTSKWGKLYTVAPFSGCVKDAVLRRKLPTLACKDFEKYVDETASKILKVVLKL